VLEKCRTGNSPPPYSTSRPVLRGLGFGNGVWPPDICCAILVTPFKPLLVVTMPISGG
jgi:hypothetical protein